MSSAEAQPAAAIEQAELPQAQQQGETGGKLFSGFAALAKFPSMGGSSTTTSGTAAAGPVDPESAAQPEISGCTQRSQRRQSLFTSSDALAFYPRCSVQDKNIAIEHSGMRIRCVPDVWLTSSSLVVRAVASSALVVVAACQPLPRPSHRR